MRESELLFKLASTRAADDIESMFNRLVQRRMKNEPFAYISGTKEFYNGKFIVNSNVLIPRPDTELLVESTLEEIEYLVREIDINDSVRVLELGVGSGAVILSIMDEFRQTDLYSRMHFSGTDISNDALNVALLNAHEMGLQDKISFQERDWVKGVDLQYYNVIVSNPPYISPQIIEELDSSVKKYVIHSLYILIIGILYLFDMFSAAGNQE